MLQRIKRTIHTWPFAIPDAEYAIDAGALEEMNLLSTPNRGRSEIFIETWLKFDLIL